MAQTISDQQLHSSGSILSTLSAQKTKAIGNVRRQANAYHAASLQSHYTYRYTNLGLWASLMKKFASFCVTLHGWALL